MPAGQKPGERSEGFLSDLPVRWKIVVVVLLVTVAVLFTLGVGFSSYTKTILRKSLLAESGILAEVIGENSTAAVQFRSDKDATSVLEALHAEPSIVLACTFDADGNLLGQYARQGAEFAVPPPLPEGKDEYFKEDYLHVFRPIQLDGRRIGTVYLRTDTERVTAGLRTVIYAMALLSLLGLGVAFLLASLLHRVITKPLHELAG
ncbi:MAG TPA: CHASE sensor domain-containing protein, partial [Kiritimatiellia bacterium]